MDEMTISELAECAESVRVGWGLMLAGQGKIERGQADYVEGVLKAAEAIVIARDAMKNDATFGKWCSDNGFSLRVINKDNRSALIRVGRNLPYWRKRLEDIKGRPPSLRLLVMDVPDEEVSQLAIPARHQTKPGPKPAAKTAEAPSDDEVAEYERLVEEGRKVVGAATAIAAQPQREEDEHESVEEKWIREAKIDPAGDTAVLLRYGAAISNAGFDIYCEDEDDRSSKVILEIFNRDLAVAWFEEALAAYDKAHPDEASDG